MELTACIQALRALKRHDIPVEVMVDSAYVLNGITNWIYNWMKKGWVTSKKEPVENKELWQRLYEEKQKFTNITFIKVKGLTLGFSFVQKMKYLHTCMKNMMGNNKG